MKGMVKMGISKKIISVVASALLCFGSYNQSISAVGTSYIKGDVDGNGVINALDLAKLVTFLNGSAAADGETAERLDVNRDYIINDYDKSFLSSILLGDEDACDMESTNTSPLPAQESIKYRIYDYDTSAYVDDYILNPVSNISVPSRSIIGGTDDREWEDSLKCVVGVRTSTNSNRGTAFILDSHTIMTVAHVLYDNDDYNNHTNPHLVSGLQFKIYSDHNTQDNSKIITPLEYHIPDKFIYDSNNPNVERSAYDYAIVRVEEDLSDYVNLEFKLGAMRNGMLNTRKLYVTGFGGAGSYVNNDNKDVKTTGSGYLKSSDQSPEMWNKHLYYDIDTIGGNSGSPVYLYDSSGNKTVIAIHGYGDIGYGNSGVRIDTDILHFAYNNPHLQ